MEQITSVGRWKLEKTVGQGSYGVVKRAVNALTQAKSAIKIVDTSKLKKPSERVALRREVSVHYTMKHRNVVEVLEVFERSGYIFIVMELVEGGDLFNHIVEKGKLDEEKARNVFIQMLNALWYCHANSVVHRDLKLENFLIDKQGTVKLTDFGFCNVMTKEKRLLETYCGSPYYCAPEIFMAQKYEGKAADIWSLGVILYAILTGSLPFVNPQGKVMFDKLMVADCPYPSHLSESSKSLIKKMLQPTPSNRAQISELLTHSWITGSIATPPSPPATPFTETPSSAPTPFPQTAPERPKASPPSSAPASPSTSRPRSSSTPTYMDPPKDDRRHNTVKDTTRVRRGSNITPRNNNDNNNNIPSGSGNQHKAGNRRSLRGLSGTWKKVTDLFALQLFAKKLEKQDNNEKDSCGNLKKENQLTSDTKDPPDRFNPTKKDYMFHNNHNHPPSVIPDDGECSSSTMMATDSTTTTTTTTTTSSSPSSNSIDNSTGSSCSESYGWEMDSIPLSSNAVKIR